MSPEEPAHRADYEEFVQTLFEMEDELGVLDLVVGGVRFWEHIRTAVFNEATSVAGLSGALNPHRPPKFERRMRTVSNTIRGLVSRNPFWRTRSDVAFWAGGRRKPDALGRWVQLRCDPIIRHLSEYGVRSVLFETAHEGRHFVPAQTPTMRYTEPVDFVAAITRRLQGGRFLPSSAERKLLWAIEQHIARKLGVDVKVQWRAAAAISKHRALLPWLRRLLRGIRPRLVFMVASYGRETLVQACRETGITTAELQHGIVGPLHPGYAFPGRGKKVMFPDYFLAFGDFWRGITPFPIPDERVVSVGLPYFEAERRRFTGTPRSDQIIFLSQATIGKQLSRLAKATAADPRVPFRVLYKLHPAEYAMWRRDYPWLRDAPLQVIDHDRTPLYQLLAESQLQVGCYSTALVEGLGLGVPTCVVDLPGSEQLRGLVARGTLAVVKSVDDLVLQLRAESPSQLTSDELFRPGALANIRAWIESKIA